MLEFLWNAGAFIVAIGLLITIHEFGHFYVARRCGVKVERFSIGFGRALWQRNGADGTEYVVAMIPLGGFVKMLDGRVTELLPEQYSQAFDRKPVGQRMAIVAAGPLANFALAVVLWFGQYLIGIPSIKPALSVPIEHSIAAKAQLPNSGIITAVEGQNIVDWGELNVALAGQIGADSITLSVETDGFTRDYRLDTAEWKVNPEAEALTTSLGLNLWTPKIYPTLSFVDDSGAAFAAGIRQGDTLTHLNGEAIDDWQLLVAAVSSQPDQPIVFDVDREGRRLQLTVVPQGVMENDKLVGKIGVAPSREPWPEQYQITQQYDVIDALIKASQQTWEFSVLTLTTFGKLLSGDLSLNNLGGPIAIAQGAGSSAGVGLVYFLGFLAILSVNLGIINLFPLPVLDGGHLLYYFIELFSGKPVPEKVQEIGFRIGSALLLLLMSFAIFNDVSRL